MQMEIVRSIEVHSVKIANRCGLNMCVIRLHFPAVVHFYQQPPFTSDLNLQVSLKLNICVTISD